MTGLRARFATFVAFAAVAPLLVFGFVSVKSLREGTEQSMAAGHLAVAEQVAARFREYFRSNQRVLDSVGSQLQGTQLAQWQRERILQNHVMDFPELREISVYDATGQPLASTRQPAPPFKVPTIPGDLQDTFVVGPVQIDPDLLPTTRIAVNLRGTTGGWIVAEISLEELWRVVDAIRMGQQGFAMLIDEEGRFIAHGNPDQKALIANRAEATADERQLSSFTAGRVRPTLPRLTGPSGRMVGVAIDVGLPNWTVLIQQPEAEALAVAYRLERQLYLAIGIALLATLIAGSWWGRSFIQRIFALTRVTNALAAGQMDARVVLTGRDEIAQLGTQFNSMADRLVELQNEIRKQERQVMFGRIAAGLVHDLSHPIQTIGNSCMLIQRIFDDAEYRATFKATVERELSTVKRVLEDLRNIARPMPLERFPIDVNAALTEAVASLTPQAEVAGLAIRSELSSGPAYIEGDLFALGRVHRNLIVNAIQATPPGGLVVVASEVDDGRVTLRVHDTGCGIPPERLHAIFEDFVTTKRRGLGLGLAISSKIVEQLGGKISVASEVGKGTTFVLEFPRAAAPPVARIAG